jgi:DNA polymerase-3 subunit delta
LSYKGNKNLSPYSFVYVKICVFLTKDIQMEAAEIVASWKTGKFRPTYWLEGEEAYEIDKITDFAEHQLLPEDQQSFNLSIFYGKDSRVEDILNACRRYPMFYERQVVIVKEAQHVKELDRLESYIEHPLPSTIFIVAHKDKKLDGRSRLSKLLKSNAVVVTTRKLYDNELPEWVTDLVRAKGLDIRSKALNMLVNHIGNDLQRIENEIDKLRINMGTRTQIDEDDIERFVGISKEFNVFELQAAIVQRDITAALHIINYFSSNPKAGPIQLLLPTLFSFFSKLYVAFSSPSRDEQSIGGLLGLRPFMTRQYLVAMQRYDFKEIEEALILLEQYNLLSVGIGRGDADDASLMRELLLKIMMKD